MLDEEVDTRTLHQIWWIWTSEGGLASIFNKPLCTRELKAHSWKLCTCVARLGHTTSKEVYLASRACTMTWLPWPGGQKAAWSLGHRDYNIPRAEGEIYALLSCAPSLVRRSCSRKKKKKKPPPASFLPPFSPRFLTKIREELHLFRPILGKADAGWNIKAGPSYFWGFPLCLFSPLSHHSSTRLRVCEPSACEVASVVTNSLWPHGLCSPPGSSVHGILPARILEWFAFMGLH